MCGCFVCDSFFKSRFAFGLNLLSVPATYAIRLFTCKSVRSATKCFILINEVKMKKKKTFALVDLCYNPFILIDKIRIEWMEEYSHCMYISCDKSNGGQQAVAAFQSSNSITCNVAFGKWLNALFPDRFPFSVVLHDEVTQFDSSSKQFH